MAYCTVADIQGRIDEAVLIRLTDETGEGLVDTDRVQEAIDDAQAEIDVYCSRLQSVPFSDPAPVIITKICKDMAVYNLYSLKNAAEEDVEDRYKRAVAFLKDVSNGVVDLGDDAPVQEDDGGPAAIKQAGTRTFSMDRMAGF